MAVTLVRRRSVKKKRRSNAPARRHGAGHVRQVLQQGVVQRAAEQGGTGGAGLGRPAAMSAARLCAVADPLGRLEGKECVNRYYGHFVA